MSLREISKVRQIKGQLFRRWFEDDYFDLIVWYEGDAIFGFQLCYGREQNEPALTWRKDSGYSHHRIDDGAADEITYRGAPILVPDGVLDADKLANRFNNSADSLEPPLAQFILDKLETYNGSK